MSTSSLGLPSYRSAGTSSSCSNENPFSFSQSMEGYDFEFVPPVEQRYECPICLLILREPRQTKCGHRFCRDCIFRWLRDSCTRCPVDNEPLVENDVFPDNFAKREILNFNIRCPNKKDGCDKIIALGKLQVHLEVCPHALVPCPFKCASILHRCDLDEHMEKQCELRTLCCDKCMASVKANVMESHQILCPKAIVLCPYCGQETAKDQLNAHKQTDCQNIQIQCPFYPFGCDHTMIRSKENEHLQAHVPAHMKQLCCAVTSIAHQLGMPRINVEKQSSSPQEGLTGTMNTLLQLFHTGSNSGALGFSEAAQEPGISSSDGSRATHQQMELASGHRGRGPSPHRSEATVLEEYIDGDHRISTTMYPSSLPLDQNVAGNNSNFVPFHFSDPGAGPLLNSVPSSTTRTKNPVCRLSYQSHATLTGDSANCQMREFYQEDELSGSSMLSQVVKLVHELSLSFEEKTAIQQQHINELQQTVANVQKINSDLAGKVRELESQLQDKEGRFCNGVLYWKIQEFSQYQMKAVSGEPSMLHSPPFYTSPWGYKMCIRANITTNSPDDPGYYLSLFVHFMQGHNDTYLSWPFSGKIVLSIIDQNPDQTSCNHITETLIAKPHLAAFQRPTTHRNHKGFGYIEFLSLGSLRTRNYLKDDTVVIRAEVTQD
ncbi:unnamed protein product [Lymnaea stagnalis]|uniref:RING-type E3 ubiquitin transferase n=1 Tax=Lymnaea stagnalis TaxID=6523 RepID=A0AAV2I9C7_LYMST